jgi:hypothetical protein
MPGRKYLKRTALTLDPNFFSGIEAAPLLPRFFVQVLFQRDRLDPVLGGRTGRTTNERL